MGFSFEHTHVHTRHTKALAPYRRAYPEKDNGFRHETGNYGTKPRSTPPTGGTQLRQAVFQRNASQTNVSQTNVSQTNVSQTNAIQADEPRKSLKKQKKSKKALR